MIFRVDEIYRKGLFRNHAYLTSLNNGERAEIRFNGAFPNTEWISKWTEEFHVGERFSGMTKKGVVEGDILKTDDIEKIRSI